METSVGVKDRGPAASDGMMANSMSSAGAKPVAKSTSPDIVFVSAPCMEHAPQPPAGIPCLVASLEEYGFSTDAVDADILYKKALPSYRWYYRGREILYRVRDRIVGGAAVPGGSVAGNSSPQLAAPSSPGFKAILRARLAAGYNFAVRHLVNAMANATPRVGWLFEDIVDGVAQDEDDSEAFIARHVLPAILAKHPRMVGISIIYPDQTALGLKIAKVIKAHDPNIYVLVGGAQITAHISKFQGAYERLKFIDGLMVHEAEVGLRELLATLKSGGPLEDVRNLYFNNGEEFKASTNADFQMPLTEYRVPNFKGFRMRDYGPVLPIRTLRGCYYNKCTFCTYPITGGKFAYTSAEFVVKNMEELHEKYGATTFELIDSSMPAKYLGDISRLLIERGHKFAWFCRANVQVQFLDEELLGLLRDGGLKALYLGVESGTERIVKMMEKMQGKHNNEMTKSIVRALHGHGIKPNIYNMFGFPTETIDEMRGSLEFILELNRKYDTGVRFANQFNLEEKTPIFHNPEKFGVTEIAEPTRGSQGYGYKYQVASGATADEVSKFCRVAQIFLRHPYLYRFRFFWGWT